MNGQSNVDQLRQANVLPPGTVMKPEDEASINALSQAEIDAVLYLHKKVGTVELTGDPKGRLFIF
ncbi:MAG: hypothetical protein ABIQ49_04530 [Gemmatimonadales bacterium]